MVDEKDFEDRLEFFPIGGSPKELMAHMVKSRCCTSHCGRSIPPPLNFSFPVAEDLGLISGLESIRKGEIGAKQKMLKEMMHNFFLSTFLSRSYVRATFYPRCFALQSAEFRAYSSRGKLWSAAQKTLADREGQGIADRLEIPHMYFWSHVMIPNRATGACTSTSFAISSWKTKTTSRKAFALPVFAPSSLPAGPRSVATIFRTTSTSWATSRTTGFSETVGWPPSAITEERSCLSLAISRGK
jgi:hypothetical protein